MDPKLQAFFDRVAGPEVRFSFADVNLHDLMTSAGFAHPEAIARVIEDLGDAGESAVRGIQIKRAKKEEEKVLAWARNAGEKTPVSFEGSGDQAVPRFAPDPGNYLDQMRKDSARMRQQAQEALDTISDPKVARERYEEIMDTARETLLFPEDFTVTPQEILRSFNVPAPVAADVTRMAQPFKFPGAVEQVLALYDVYQDLFKTHVTATNPGFHMRNLFSGFLQNAMNGVTDPTQKGLAAFIKPYKDAGKLMTGDVVEGAASIPFFEGRQWLDQAGQVVTDAKAQDALASDELRRIVFSEGLLDSPGMHRDLVASGGQRPEALVPGLQKREGLVDWIVQRSKPRPGAEPAGKYRHAIRLARSTGDAVEAGHRAGGLIALMRQGYAPSEAARRIRLLHVDYSNLSTTEREVFRRMFPFYAYSRGMIEYIAKELAERPGGPIAMSIKAANRTIDREEAVPDYVSEGFSVPLGTGSQGTKHFITGLGLMHEAPLNLMSPNPQRFIFGLGSMLNPVLKAPIELATNESLFQSSPQGGRSLDDLDPLIGRLGSNVTTSLQMLGKGNVKGLALGTDEYARTPPWRLPKTLELAVANSPASRYLSTARQLADPRKNLLQKALGTGTGLRLTSISPAAQDAVLRERVEAIIRKYGGRIFERSYIPQEVLDEMSPDEREVAQQWMELMRVLGKRAKERKKQREAQDDGSPSLQ
jgi:hypothetical protein